MNQTQYSEGVFPKAKEEPPKLKMTLTLEKRATEKTFSIRYVCVSVY
jgi:hypothetical protein